MGAACPLRGVVVVRAFGPVAQVEEVDAVDDSGFTDEKNELVTETYALPPLLMEPLFDHQEVATARF